jgi:tetratricopeptide (TPR) repeat protein
MSRPAIENEASMNTPALTASVDELLANYAAEAARNGPLLPLAALLARLREPPRDAAFWARVGDAMIRNGFAEPAAVLLAAGLQHFPQTVELLYLRGNALRVAQRFDEAEASFRAALARTPGHDQAALSLAFMLRERGRIEAAAGVLQAQWRAAHGTPEQTLERLEFLRGSGALRQARELADAAAACWPQHARLAATAGELELAFGAFSKASESLRRAVQLDPAHGPAWLRLSYCRRCTDVGDPDLALLRAAWNDARLPAVAKACAGFGLGKLLDDLDDWADAAAVLRDANALARAQTGWSTDAWNAALARRLAQGPLPALDAVAGFVPVFIVGLPRSGTTLVATRLARYAGVRDRGELNWIAGMYEHLASQNALANRDALQSVATLIATQMRRDDAPARCYIDKNPLNFRYLDLLLALFPNARIVHCRRGARDIALSLFSQHFAHPDLAFSYDFSSIALVQNGHEGLMAHWRRTLPAPILDVDYEKFVADADGETARIAEFVGLPATSAAGQSGADSVITTASVWQARQPIHSGAVERWRRYAKYLPELTTLFS